jgi:hypothetical protein
MVKAVALFLVLILAGCGPQLVQADVTRFHALPPAGAAPSFTILPDAAQLGSLEFESYAQLVAAQLQGRGWRPVAAKAGAEAETMVRLSWGAGPPHTEYWSSPSSIYGGAGWGRNSWRGGGVWDPFPYTETRSLTTYGKWLTVDVLDGPAFRRGGTVKLFEGRAVAEGASPAVAPAIPYLVKALFTNFPGASGSTVRVAVPVTP